ncbi:MAG: hypothetical protein ABIJ35_06060, partial [Acidobacteriota bacterium]
MSRQDQLLKSLGLLQELGKRQNSITHVQHIPAKQGRYEDYPGNIHPALVGALKRKGFNRLYTHQHQSWT